MALPERDAARDWVGMTVVDRDDTEIGSCTAVFADEATGRPEWVRVEHGDGTAVVPLVDAAEIDGRVRVVVSRADVLGAPSATGDHLSEVEEVSLYQHYGIAHSRAASESLLPVTEAPADAPTGSGDGSPGAPEDETAPRGDGAAPGHQAAPAGRRIGPVVVAGAGAALGAVAIAAARSRRGRRVLRPPTAAERARAASAAARARAAHVAGSAGPLLADASDAARSGATQLAASAVPLLASASDAARSGATQLAASAGPLLAGASGAVRLGVRSAAHSARRAAALTPDLVAGAAARTSAGLAAVGLTGVRSGLRFGGAVASVPEVVAEGGHRVQKGWRKTKRTSSLALGLGTGYVLGARAGQERFEQIRDAAASATRRPEVQRVLARVGAGRGDQDGGGAPSGAAGGDSPGTPTVVAPVPATDAGIPPGAVAEGQEPTGTAPRGTDDGRGPTAP